MSNPWKGIVGVSLLAAPVLALSATTTFYAGLGGGVALSSAEIFKEEIGITFLRPDLIQVSYTTLPWTGDSDNVSGVGQLQLGGGVTFGSVYLGLEALGQLSDGKFDEGHGKFVTTGFNPEVPSSTVTFETNLRMRDFEPAIDFKPGFILYRDTLVYGRIGAAFNELTLRLEEQQDAINSLLQNTIDTSESEDVVGLRLGLGVEHKLKNQLAIFLDYTFTSYEDISLETTESVAVDLPDGSGGFFPLLIQSDNNLDASDIQKQVVMLGVNYHF